MDSPEEIPFQELLTELQDTEKTLNPRFLYRLSDLDEVEVAQLAEIWSDIPLWRRQALLEDIEDLSKTDMLLSYESLGAFAAKDENPGVRLHAVRTLWEFENKSLIPLFTQLIQEDPDSEVRAASASALGRYVYLGELEEIPASDLREIEELLLSVVRGSDLAEVRRAGLEALGYSSREEISPLIETAFTSVEKEWIASALFAMGRSGNQIWEKQVLGMLESNIPLLRSEAARAAGELELSKAVPLLIDLLDDPDENTRDTSVWSLSQIGGEGVREIIEALFDNAETEAEMDLYESALDNLAFTEGMQFMPLFDFSDIDDDESLDLEGDEPYDFFSDEEELED